MALVFRSIVICVGDLCSETVEVGIAVHLGIGSVPECICAVSAIYYYIYNIDCAYKLYSYLYMFW